MSNSESDRSNKENRWSSAADHAKAAAASAGDMASHLGSAAGVLAGQAVGDLKREADELVVCTGKGAQVVGDRMLECCPQDGVLATAAQGVAHSIKSGGQYLEEAKLGGITADIARTIRRNPLSAILIALGMGWCLGRRIRG